MADKALTSPYLKDVLKRTQELARISSGKASESPGNPEKRPRMENGSGQAGGQGKISQHSASGPAIRAITQGSSDAQCGNNESRSAQGETPGSNSALWERISKMEADKSQQTDLLSSLVLNVAKLQQTMEKNEKSLHPNDCVQTSDRQSDDGISVVMDAELEIEIDESSASDLFLAEFEPLYAEEKNFGPDIDEKLSELFNRAIDKNVADDQLKQLQDRYPVPGNCCRMDVPMVNKELWTAVKEKRESDLALQSVQKYFKLAMVPTLQALDIIKNKGDQSKFPQIFKDLFKILASGIFQCNKKRKSLIKPALPYKYRKVCDVDAPITSNLFGDDLEAKVEEIEKEEKRSQKFQADHFLSKTPAQKGRGNQWNTYKQTKGSSHHYKQGKSQSSRGKPQSRQTNRTKHY